MMDPRQMEKLGISCRTAGNIDCGHSRDFSDHSLITAGGNLSSTKINMWFSLNFCWLVRYLHCSDAGLVPLRLVRTWMTGQNSVQSPARSGPASSHTAPCHSMAARGETRLTSTGRLKLLFAFNKSIATFSSTQIGGNLNYQQQVFDPLLKLERCVRPRCRLAILYAPYAGGPSCIHWFVLQISLQLSIYKTDYEFSTVKMSNLRLPFNF